MPKVSTFWGGAASSAAFMDFLDRLKTSQEQVRGHSGLTQAGNSNQIGHTLWEDATKSAKWSRAAAFIMVPVSLAVTREDRLVNTNINTFPSCLIQVSWETSNYHANRRGWAQRRKRLCLLTCGIVGFAESLSWGEIGIGWVFKRYGSDTFRSTVSLPGFL